MTLSRSKPRAKSRWVALLGLLLLGSMTLATSALAAPSFTFTEDDQGANDEPGQKDLTADAAAFDLVTGDFYTAWKWDDTSWSGSNTGDACSLFDTDADGNANYAVCVTVGKPAIETSTRVYSCGDARPDRCTGSVLEGTETAASDWCTVSQATATFPPPPTGDDTQATCNISQVVADVATVTGLDNGTLLNSCSYPSQQPNSDPSDCVRRVAVLNTSTATQIKNTNGTTDTANDTNVADGGSVSIGTGVYDTASLSNNTSTAGGTLSYYVQKQLATDTSPNCSSGSLIGSAVTVTNASVPASATVTLSSAGTYEFWAVYSGDANNVGSTSTCGSETVVVNPNTNGISTTQAFVPNDSATLTGLTTTAGGTITFKLFPPSNATCSVAEGAPAPVVNQTLNVTGSQSVYSTTNSAAVSAEGTYRWLVTYTGDGNNSGATSACGIETFVVDNNTAN